MKKGCPRFNPFFIALLLLPVQLLLTQPLYAEPQRNGLRFSLDKL